MGCYCLGNECCLGYWCVLLNRFRVVLCVFLVCLCVAGFLSDCFTCCICGDFLFGVGLLTVLFVTGALVLHI